jgi:hypothetical protein
MPPRAKKCNTGFVIEKNNKQKISIPVIIFCMFPLFISNKPNTPQTTSNEPLVISQRTHARSYLKFRPTRRIQEHKEYCLPCREEEGGLKEEN